MSKVSMKNLGLEGVAKWVHRFVMFITYPFRHFFVFLALIAVAMAICIAVPLFKGVSFHDIPEWYGQKLGIVESVKKPQIKAAPKKIKVTKFKKEVKLKHAAFEPKPVLEKKKEEPKASEPEKYATWNIKNKIAPQKEIKVVNNEISEPDIENIQQVQEPVKVEEKKVSVKTETSSGLKYQKRDDLNLKYYQTPKHISGEAIIYGANEIFVDDTYLYLYGIYTNPNFYNEGQARSYLRELIAGQKTDCYIVAETKEGIATAICFAAGKNINESMVKAYLADNIAL